MSRDVNENYIDDLFSEPALNKLSAKEMERIRDESLNPSFIKEIQEMNMEDSFRAKDPSDSEF